MCWAFLARPSPLPTWPTSPGMGPLPWGRPDLMQGAPLHWAALHHPSHPPTPRLVSLLRFPVWGSIHPGWVLPASPGRPHPFLCEGPGPACLHLPGRPQEAEAGHVLLPRSKWRSGRGGVERRATLRTQAAPISPTCLLFPKVSTSPALEVPMPGFHARFSRQAAQASSPPSAPWRGRRRPPAFTPTARCPAPTKVPQLPHPCLTPLHACFLLAGSHPGWDQSPILSACPSTSPSLMARGSPWGAPGHSVDPGLSLRIIL